MRAEDLLAEVEELGVIVSLDHDDLLLRPKSRLPTELIEQLRAHKSELVELVTLRGWPEASRDCVRRFRRAEARLYPFLGKEVTTPEGGGRLLQVFRDRAAVALGREAGRVVFVLPSEVRPKGLTAVSPPFEEVH